MQYLKRFHLIHFYGWQPDRYNPTVILEWILRTKNWVKICLIQNLRGVTCTFQGWSVSICSWFQIRIHWPTHPQPSCQDLYCDSEELKFEVVGIAWVIGGRKGYCQPHTLCIKHVIQVWCVSVHDSYIQWIKWLPSVSFFVFWAFESLKWKLDYWVL